MEEYDRIRMSQIHNMLLEVGSGNFTHRITRTDRNDSLEAIVVLMNMMADELQQRFRLLRVPQPAAVQDLEFLALLLNSEFRVLQATGTASELLEPQLMTLPGIQVIALLDAPSAKGWYNNLERPAGLSHTPVSHLLHFRSREGQNFPLHCTLFPLKSTGPSDAQYLLTGYGSSLREGGKPGKDRRGPTGHSGKTGSVFRRDQALTFKKHDRQTIENIHEYILQHLDKPLPNLKSLAHQFGTNEFKLKYGFKKVYGITVFRFLLRERLRRAGLLLRNTEIPLKKIAGLTGFKSYPHFSRVFKRLHKVGPRQYRNQHGPTENH